MRPRRAHLLALLVTALLAVLTGVTAVAGCSSTEGSGGGNDAPRLRKEAPKKIVVPPGSTLLDRSENRGSNPSGAEFDSAVLKPPLPPLYIRITTEPPAAVTVSGTILCQDINTAASVQSDLPFTDGDGELVVRVPLPRGVREGMECSPIFAGGAQTDPGKITRVTSELLAAPR